MAGLRIRRERAVGRPIVPARPRKYRAMPPKAIKALAARGRAVRRRFRKKKLAKKYWTKPTYEGALRRAVGMSGFETGGMKTRLRSRAPIQYSNLAGTVAEESLFGHNFRETHKKINKFHFLTTAATEKAAYNATLNLIMEGRSILDPTRRTAVETINSERVRWALDRQLALTGKGENDKSIGKIRERMMAAFARAKSILVTVAPEPVPVPAPPVPGVPAPPVAVPAVKLPFGLTPEKALIGAGVVTGAYLLAKKAKLI